MLSPILDVRNIVILVDIETGYKRQGSDEDRVIRHGGGLYQFSSVRAFHRNLQVCTGMFLEEFDRRDGVLNRKVILVCNRERGIAVFIEAPSMCLKQANIR